jgi:hypothetical protein
MQSRHRLECFLRDTQRVCPSRIESTFVSDLRLQCPRCESEQFIVSSTPLPRDLATCGRCRGRFIYGHLTDAAEAELVRAAHKATSNAAKAQPAQPRITSIIDLLRQWFPTRS